MVGFTVSMRPIQSLLTLGLLSLLALWSHQIQGQQFIPSQEPLGPDVQAFRPLIHQASGRARLHTAAARILT